MTSIKFLFLILIIYMSKLYLNFKFIKVTATYKKKFYIILISLHKKVINIRETYNFYLFLFININVYSSNIKCIKEHIFNFLCHIRYLAKINNLFCYIKFSQCCHIDVFNHIIKFYFNCKFCLLSVIDLTLPSIFYKLTVLNFPIAHFQMMYLIISLSNYYQINKFLKVLYYNLNISLVSSFFSYNFEYSYNDR